MARRKQSFSFHRHIENAIWLSFLAYFYALQSGQAALLRSATAGMLAFCFPGFIP
jgi:hypothetical protein